MNPCIRQDVGMKEPEILLSNPKSLSHYRGRGGWEQLW